MIVIVLRHADRQPDPADDLTAAGRARAKLLARMLADSAVSVAYRTEFVRARKTLAPLQKKLGVGFTVKEVALGVMAAESHADQVVAAVKAEPDDATVLVVGHSDTVRLIVQGLSGKPVTPIAADEFDRMFVLCLAPAAAALLELRYGA